MLKVGDVFNGYHLEQYCGCGCCSTVYVATNPDGVKVALKLVGKQTGMGARREAKAMHEYQKHSWKKFMLQIGNVAEDEDYFYYEMELANPVPGMKEYVPDTLAVRLMNGKRLSVRQTASLINELMWSVRELHSADVVHRDIKPSNIFFFGKESIAKLGDIGAMCESNSSTIPMGTPGFSAMTSVGIDPNTPKGDLFSSACVAYTCLTGEEPGLLSIDYSKLAKIDGVAPVAQFIKKATDAKGFQNADEAIEFLNSKFKIDTNPGFESGKECASAISGKFPRHDFLVSSEILGAIVGMFIGIRKPRRQESLRVRNDARPVIGEYLALPE
ncbi:MAG: protein kinase [Victivallaceae bacterium]|nr:protein kinase [Victivallaceae bacterium]